MTDAVATITLDRPDAMNSLTAEVKAALLAALRRAREPTSGVRAVLLTGSGRAFCAGQDLREHAANLEAGRGLADTVREHYNPIVELITTMAKPVVAAVNGVAAGAGASLAFACDLRVASEKAKFAMAFAGIGLAPDSGASWTLQRLVGLGRASELMLLGEPVDAARALELGLVTRVVPADELRKPPHGARRTAGGGADAAPTPPPSGPGVRRDALPAGRPGPGGRPPGRAAPPPGDHLDATTCLPRQGAPRLHRPLS